MPRDRCSCTSLWLRNEKRNRGPGLGKAWYLPSASFTNGALSLSWQLHCQNSLEDLCGTHCCCLPHLAAGQVGTRCQTVPHSPFPAGGVCSWLSNENQSKANDEEDGAEGGLCCMVLVSSTGRGRAAGLAEGCAPPCHGETAPLWARASSHPAEFNEEQSLLAYHYSKVGRAEPFVES